jgi:hypothetical protein
VLEGHVSRVIINAKLIIECKNYADPLVIIGQDGARYHNGEPTVTFDPLLIEFADRSPENYAGIEAQLEMWKLPSHVTRGFIGGQLIKMRRQNGRWQATNESVYDSIIYPLAKAAEHERKGETGSALDSEVPWSVPQFIYTFPVLITAGTIFTVDVVPDGIPVVRPVKWSPVTRQFSDYSFMMDVVSFDCIDDYLDQRIFPTLTEAHEVLASNMQLFNPEWLQHQYGESSDPNFRMWLEVFRSSAEKAD